MPATPASSFNGDDCQLSTRVETEPTTEPKTESVAWPSPATTTTTASNPGRHDTVTQAYDVVYRAFCGLYPEDSPTFSLDQQSFEAFLDRIKATPEIDAFFESVRYDWDGDELTLILMEHPLHGVFKSLFDRELHRKLDRIAEAPALAPFCNKIIPAGTVAVELLNRRSRPTIHKSPDLQTLYKGYKRPPLVSEVAWSHKDLEQKGRQYLSRFNGEVTTFVGFDLSYAPRKERKAHDYHYDGSVVLWTVHDAAGSLRARLRKARVFRRRSTAVPGVLEIQFAWLLPLAEREKLPPEQAQAVLRFDFSELTQLLAKAESIQRERDATPPPLLSPPRREKRNICFEDDDGNVLSSDSPSDDDDGRESKRRRQSQPETSSSRVTRSRSRIAEGSVSLRTRSRATAEGSESIRAGSESE
ncbi:hypothetical protein CHU98_g8360 [Xylaria longipes]|nr:hypothetical protein CHU98_g8360 [Xylaria longipes]